MVSAPIHGYARRLASLLSVSFLATALWLTAAGPTFACSCMGPQPMAFYATEDTAVFSGTTGPKDNRGVPVRVATWFSGRGAAPIVYLASSSFGDSAGCGTNVPPAGMDMIWVTYLPEDGGDPVSGLCSPHAQLGTPEGDAMLKDAMATFGGVVPLAARRPIHRVPRPPIHRRRRRSSRPSDRRTACQFCWAPWGSPSPFCSGSSSSLGGKSAPMRDLGRAIEISSSFAAVGAITLVRREGHGRAAMGGSQRNLPPPARERPGP